MTEQKKMGRPTSYTEDVHKVITASLRAGVTRKAAAAIGGITCATLRNWIARGLEDGEGKFYEFALDVAATEAIVEREMTQVIATCATRNEDWRAALVWLERRVPAWRPGQTQEIQIEHTQKQATPQEAARIMSELFGKVTPAAEPES